MKILLDNQESCMINGDNTTKCFKLEKGTRKGDTISAYLFVLVLKIVYLSIKENKNIKSLNNQTTFYTAHTADTTQVMKVFGIFSSISDLKPDKSKCELKLMHWKWP